MNDFFASFYEIWGLAMIGQNGEFSNALYDNNLYQLIGFFIVFSSCLFFFMFYYWPINHPRWNKTWIWFVFFLILCLILSITLTIMINTQFQTLQKDFSITEYLTFGFLNFIYSFILSSIILPLLFKRWSINCCRTPKFLTFKKYI